MDTIKNDTRKIFWTKGPCSHALYYILNREFGHLKENEEHASDPLAGGIMQNGHQCGMIWGATLAVGAESFRRNENHDQAIGMAISASQHLAESFSKRAKSLNCRTITNTNLKSSFGLLTYFLKGGPISCTNLAVKWAPEAIKSAKEGLLLAPAYLPEQPLSCASEVARRMGATDEEIVTVAGFAGGIGLSGNGCGALAAAVWIAVLREVRKGKWEYTLNDPLTKNILSKFRESTGNEMVCKKITGQRFNSITDHTEFIKKGGCENLITILSKS
jgi:hypothetical protein